MSEINTWPGWEHVELLGEGSFGKVYKIRREEFGVVNEAALKVITIPSSQADLAAAKEEGMDDASVTNYFKSFVEDLAAEFALMSSLKGNSNIVSYEDHMVVPREGEVGWDILIRMELLTPLQTAASEKPLTERDVVNLGMDMCRALTLCRNRGIIHRDIKPENIFVSKDGNYKLGDFGVARVAEKTVSAMSRKGTYSYMAPEVYRSEKYGFGADIYSLGIVLYRYLNNNRLPFLPPYPAPLQYSDRENALARRIGGEALPAPENGSQMLKSAVLKACAYRVEDRYGSSEDFMADLESALEALGGKERTEGGADRERFSPKPGRSLPEETESDEFDKTMSAAVLGQKANSSSADTGKKGSTAQDVPVVSGGTPAGRGEEKQGSGKKKAAVIAAVLGVSALAAAVFVIKGALGGKAPDIAGSPDAVQAQAAAAEQSKEAAQDVPEEESKEAAQDTAQAGAETRSQEAAQAAPDIDSLLETPSDTEWLASRREAVKAFDGRLTGSWVSVSVEQNGEQDLYGLDTVINILETGQFYLKSDEEWLHLMEQQISLPVMTVSGTTARTTDLVEAASIYDDGRPDSNYIYNLLPSISDLVVTYDLTDYEAQEDDSYAAFYAANRLDGLTVRVQGNYQDGPLTVKTIDTSFCYRQDLNRIRNWLFPSLEGRWVDDRGNIWAFQVDRQSEELVFPMLFAMKDPSGRIYEGDGFSVNYEPDTASFSLRMDFQDGIEVPEYTMVNYDGMSLELKGEDGTKLLLTRD